MAQLPAFIETEMAKLLDQPAFQNGEFQIITNWSPSDDIMAVVVNRNGKFAGQIQIAPFVLFAVGADWQKQLIDSVMSFLQKHIPDAAVVLNVGLHVARLLTTLGIQKALLAVA